MFNAKEYSVEDLKTIAESIKAELKERKSVESEANKAVKAERAAKFAGLVEEGNTVRFLYKKEELEGEVIRVNPKSVTIEINGKPVYIKYENILEIV